MTQKFNKSNIVILVLISIATIFAICLTAINIATALEEEVIPEAEATPEVPAQPEPEAEGPSVTPDQPEPTPEVVDPAAPEEELSADPQDNPTNTDIDITLIVNNPSSVPLNC